MQYKELSPGLKRRFQTAKCPLCGKKLSTVENTEYVFFRNGRYKEFVFFHTECLRKFQEVERGYQNAETKVGSSS